jgi:mannose-6-phosphate isomerase-like protein (cupin superfamily)
MIVASAANREREAFTDPRRGDASWFTFFSGDRTPTSGMSAGVMELAPHGGILQPHRHAQAEIYFVAEGEGVLTVDGVTTRIAQGTSVFIPGDAEHAIRNEGGATLKIFYVFATDRFADVAYRFTENGLS